MKTGTWSRTESEEGLLRTLASIGDAELLRALLKEVLTDAEYRAIAKRWAILEMLRAGLPQRTVAREIGGSLCNVTRGARILRNPDSVAARFLPDKKDKKEKK